MARYIIILDRYDGDDNCGPDGHEPRTDQEGIEQVAAELQEAMEQTGEPAGFFNVVARLPHTRPNVGSRPADEVLTEVLTQLILYP